MVNVQSVPCAFSARLNTAAFRRDETIDATNAAAVVS